MDGWGGGVSFLRVQLNLSELNSELPVMKLYEVCYEHYGILDYIRGMKMGQVVYGKVISFTVAYICRYVRCTIYSRH